jgi:hypothetical protein
MFKGALETHLSVDGTTQEHPCHDRSRFSGRETFPTVGPCSAPPRSAFVKTNLSFEKTNFLGMHRDNAEAAAHDQCGIFPMYVSAPESKP